MAVNSYTPAGLTYRNAYNWQRSSYNVNDVPGLASVRDPAALRAQTAYEWFQWGSPTPGDGGNARSKSNPPFLSGAAGRLLPGLTVAATGAPARVLRGFIRRAEYSVSDFPSQCRLYFMYNPEQINREYVSYLDQGALDPFNTVFQSGNLVAPPSFMNFTFEMFYDRQDEAARPNNPGVFVDYEFFDLVVRNVIPGNYTNGQIPDNGVMMVNPRDITVVFSPQITVQGRPLNASVSFEKFTHRMTPTRMRIQLTMRVVYLGPLREMTTYTQEEFTVEHRIPWRQHEPEAYNFTYADFQPPENPADDGSDSDSDSAHTALDELDDVTDTASQTTNTDIVDFAVSVAQTNNTQYNVDNRKQLWAYADCSSFVWGAFAATGHSTVMGWEAWPAGVSPTATSPSVANTNQIGTQGMFDLFKAGKACTRLFGFDKNGGLTSGRGGTDGTTWKAIMDKCKKGDLVLRNHNEFYTGSSQGHVAWIYEVNEDEGYFKTFHAASESLDITSTTHYEDTQNYYNYGVRPKTSGGGSVNNGG